MFRSSWIVVFIYLFFGCLLAMTACNSGQKNITTTTNNKEIPHAIVIGSSTLSWETPTSYIDGSPLIIQGYRVYYGTASGVYSGMIDLNGNTATTDFTGLFSGASMTYYFAVAVYDPLGIESNYSNETSRFINIP